MLRVAFNDSAQALSRYLVACCCASALGAELGSVLREPDYLERRARTNSRAPGASRFEWTRHRALLRCAGRFANNATRPSWLMSLSAVRGANPFRAPARQVSGQSTCLPRQEGGWKPRTCRCSDQVLEPKSTVDIEFRRIGEAERPQPEMMAIGCATKSSRPPMGTRTR